MNQFCSMLDSKEQALEFQKNRLNQFLKNAQENDVEDYNGQNSTRLAIAGAGGNWSRAVG